MMNFQFTKTPYKFPKYLKKAALHSFHELSPSPKQPSDSRLGLLKECIENINNENHTIVVIPSLSFDRESIQDIVGLLHYETRALWETLKLSNNHTRIIFVSSIPIKQSAIDHMLSLIPNAHDCQERLKLISLGDASIDKCLCDKILNRYFVINKIKSAIKTENCYLNTFVATEKENQLAQLLEIPLYGKKDCHYHLQTKSGNKKIFEKAGITTSKSFYDIKSQDELINKIIKLWGLYPQEQSFMIKLDDGVSGLGNAIFRLPIEYQVFSQYHKDQQLELMCDFLREVKFQSDKQTWDHFSQQIHKGCIVELFINGKNKTSPSCQAMINPFGQVEILSTHEQLLDDSGMAFLGSRFPAKKDHRLKLQAATLKIGQELAKEGVIGPFSVDFLISTINHRKHVHAIEINLRQGGTTHPYQTAKLLTQSTFDESSGNLVSGGDIIYYQSNDNFLREELISTDENDLIHYLKKNHLIYNHKSKCGIVLHMLGSLHENGKLGYTAIGTSTTQVTCLNKRVLKALETYCQMSTKVAKVS